MLHFTSIPSDLTCDDIGTTTYSSSFHLLQTYMCVYLISILTIAAAIVSVLPDCRPIDIRIRYSRGKQSKSIDRRAVPSHRKTSHHVNAATNSNRYDQHQNRNGDGRGGQRGRTEHVKRKTKVEYHGYGSNQAFVFFHVRSVLLLSFSSHTNHGRVGVGVISHRTKKLFIV
jgi:hypothetical protein